MGYGLGDDLEPGEGLASMKINSAQGETDQQRFDRLMAMRLAAGRRSKTGLSDEDWNFLDAELERGRVVSQVLPFMSPSGIADSERNYVVKFAPAPDVSEACEATRAIIAATQAAPPATDLDVARVAIGACVGDLLLGRSPNTRRVIGLADAVGALHAVAKGLEHVAPVESRDRLPWIQARIADLVAEYHAAYPGDDGSTLRYALEGAADRDRREREQARKAARQASQGK